MKSKTVSSSGFILYIFQQPYTVFKLIDLGRRLDLSRPHKSIELGWNNGSRCRLEELTEGQRSQLSSLLAD